MSSSSALCTKRTGCQYHGKLYAVLYDPYTPPITADLDNHMHLNALSGFVRIVMDVPDSSLHYEWEAYSSDGSEVLCNIPDCIMSVI